MALKPLVWLAWSVEAFASFAMRADVTRLRLQVADKDTEILILERDLQIKNYQVEALEMQVNAMRAAEAANLQLLDHVVQTHGFNTSKP